MKNLKSLALCVCLCYAALSMISCNGEQERKYELGTGFVVDVSIEGNLELLAKDSIYLKSTMPNSFFEMALPIEKGKAVFICDTMITPQDVRLYGIGNDGKKLQISLFFLENCHASIKVVFDQNYPSKVRADVAGCPTHDMFRKLFEKRMALTQEFKLDSLGRVYDKMGILSKEKFKLLVDSVRVLAQEYENSLIDEDPLSIFAFERFASSFITKGSVDENIARYRQFANSGKFNDNVRFKMVGKMLDALQKTQVNCMALDFTLKDMTGKNVTLSDVYKSSKITMLDFWASWCADCRKENPAMVAINKTYASRGLSIIGVSLDNEFSDWKKAVQDDKLTWTQVSDLHGWNNAAAEMYCVKVIPQNILIDSTGVIIARNISPDEVEELLKEQLPGKTASGKGRR